MGERLYLIANSRRFRSVVAAVVGALLLVSPVSAAKATPFAWTLAWQVFQSPVEQESPDYLASPGGVMNVYYCTHNADGSTHPDTCVSNTTGCDWDPDDSTQWRGFGTVSAGQSFSRSFCVIADGYDNTGGDQHRVQARIVTTTPNLTITFANDRGATYSATPTPSGNKGWQWLFCERDLTDVGQPISFYPVIPNSNGGTGEIVTYTVSVTVGAIHGATNLEIDTSTGNSGPADLGCPISY